MPKAMTQEQRDVMDAVHMNVLEATSKVVPSVREEILAFFALAKTILGNAAPAVLVALEEGTLNAPEGVTVYHEQLQMLQVFEALDKAMSPNE